MNTKRSIIAGIVLILLGLVALAYNLAGHLFGFWMWRFWPVLVIAVSLAFLLPPLLVRGKRGLGALFILGLPILVTGGILLFTSTFNVWHAWSRLWPLEILALALGFLFAAIYTRSLGLIIPAVIIGANGLLFQFCALTGWWEVWSVLWTVEPLSVGLALLIFGILKRSTGLLMAGIILIGVGGVGMVGMTAILSLTTLWPSSWIINLVGPITIIAAGLFLLVLSLIRRSTATVSE